ncbi:MAG: tRNA (adenosine(37)-N6)-dimethylallyltransferase MiaA [Bacteroidetes bacterium]|nr:tRNA (adenosine(37)-N6)-dimethylallyltransferase MiaA [Bacteroidota bacterium]
MARVPHHFIDSHSITENFSAGQFAEQSSTLLSALFKKNKVVVAVGGTGLYIKALTEGFDEMPEIDPAIRIQLNQLYEKEGLAPIQKIVAESDPLFYGQVDKKNRARLIRAAEVILSTGQPYSGFRMEKVKDPYFTELKIVIDWPRDLLYERINLRVDHMMNEGLLQEVESLHPFKEHNALKTVGYTELFEYLQGKFTLPEAAEKIKQHSRNYAKRQVTWFRNQGNYSFVSPSETIEFLKSGVNLK